MRHAPPTLSALLLVLASLSGPAISTAIAAIPFPMTSGNYSENFADIANWTNNFASGIGAQYWASVPINANGTIPDGVRITVSTATFVTGTTGGVQKGSGNIQLLSTNTADNTHAVAIDLPKPYGETGPTETADDPYRRAAELMQSWREAGVKPAAVVDDARFLRRATLDLTGLIPTVGEIRTFLADVRADNLPVVTDDQQSFVFVRPPGAGFGVNGVPTAYPRGQSNRWAALSSGKPSSPCRTRWLPACRKERPRVER